MCAKPWAQISRSRLPRPSTSSLKFEIQSQRMKIDLKISAHVSQAMGSDLKFSATRPSTSSLRFEIQSQRMKKRNSKFQLMRAKPWAQISTNNWRFEVQLQRMKIKIKISAHVSQALGLDINKQLEV
jgi:hypothetical protein